MNECDIWVMAGLLLYSDENLSGDYLVESPVRYRHMRLDGGSGFNDYLASVWGF